MRRPRRSLEGRGDQRPPLVPLRARMVLTGPGELLQVAPEGPSERDVQDLASPAHAEHRHVVLDGEERVGQVDLVQEGLPRQVLRMWLRPPVPPRLDVAPAGQDQSVDPLDQVDAILLLFVVREEDGKGARREQRAPVPVAVVVAVVGEAFRDRDQWAPVHHRSELGIRSMRPRNPRQWPAGRSQPSSTGGVQPFPRSPTPRPRVRAPAAGTSRAASSAGCRTSCPRSGASSAPCEPARPRAPPGCRSRSSGTSWSSDRTRRPRRPPAGA